MIENLGLASTYGSIDDKNCRLSRDDFNANIQDDL
jgi:hypothetical protein